MYFMCGPRALQTLNKYKKKEERGDIRRSHKKKWKKCPTRKIGRKQKRRTWKDKGSRKKAKQRKGDHQGKERNNERARWWKNAESTYHPIKEMRKRDDHE